MALFEIEYYIRPNGDRPVGDWLNQLHIDFRKVMMAKVVSLSEHGLDLLSTKVLERIQGDDRDFYELRGGRCRIAAYYDEMTRKFILLHGFIKTRDNERREIDRARDLLREYLHAR
ncbi:MAG: hypothetical protein FJZ83_02900 [Chloroflexi bacterium]|nr:hypothetical protein [Chloroflexota bacterium]MBM3155502.1 hypothetical protein [Chloroflexota bacterium]MBM3182962.1 hypothetical protein [Chloroflexota bacterium]